LGIKSKGGEPAWITAARVNSMPRKVMLIQGLIGFQDIAYQACANIFRPGSGLLIDAKVPFLRAAHSETMASIFPSVAELGVNASGFSMT